MMHEGLLLGEVSSWYGLRWLYRVHSWNLGLTLLSRLLILLKHLTRNVSSCLKLKVLHHESSVLLLLLLVIFWVIDLRSNWDTVWSLIVKTEICSCHLTSVVKRASVISVWLKDHCFAVLAQLDREIVVFNRALFRSFHQIACSLSSPWGLGLAFVDLCVDRSLHAVYDVFL